MINKTLKLVILLLIGFASFVCYCICFASTSTSYSQLASASYMTSKSKTSGITTYIYWGLVAVSSVSTNKGVTEAETSDWSNYCTDDDFGSTCSKCLSANNAVMGTVSIAFIAFVVAVAINVAQFRNPVVALSIFGALCMFISWLMTMAAFSNYVSECYNNLYDDVSNLEFGNAFNATVVVFLLSFISFWINLIPVNKIPENNMLNAGAPSSSSSGPLPPPI